MSFSFTRVLAGRHNSTFSLHNSILLHRCNIFKINLVIDRYTDRFQIWAIRICLLWYVYYDMLCCKHICMKTPIFISFVNRPQSRLPGSHVNLFITLIKPANCFPQMTATVPISSCGWQVSLLSQRLCQHLLGSGGSAVAFLVVSVQRLSSRGFPWQFLTD